MKPKLAINGFGRIGRTLAKLNLIKKNFDLVAVNDINPFLDNMAYLFKYDSTYGVFKGDIAVESNNLIINGKPVRYFNQPSLDSIEWDALGIDLIIDATGVSSNIDLAKSLVKTSNVKHVVITHSSDKTHKEIIMGINEDSLTKADTVVSNSICDANAIAHVLKWLDEEYQIETGSITTLHPWLSYQNLTDSPSISQNQPGSVWKGFSLGRASAGILIPKDTTAMTAVEKVLPQLKDKIMSFSYRIPTNIVASADLSLKLKNIPSEAALRNFMFSKIKNSKYVRGNQESLVSIDYEREEHSAVIDIPWLKSKNGLIKVILWYDNEWGYSSRTLDLAEHLVALE